MIFASNRQDGVDFQLYTLPLSTDGTATGTPVDLAGPPSGASDDYPSWAPAAPGEQDPDHLRQHPEGEPELYTEDLDTPGSVAPVFSQIRNFSDTEPVYDPSNANEIAFVRTSDGGKSQIYTYNLVTRSLVDLSAADGDGTRTTRSPTSPPHPTARVRN